MQYSAEIEITVETPPMGYEACWFSNGELMPPARYTAPPLAALHQFYFCAPQSIQGVATELTISHCTVK